MSRVADTQPPRSPHQAKTRFQVSQVFVGLVLFSLLGTGASMLLGLDASLIQPAVSMLTLLTGLIAVVWAFLALSTRRQSLVIVGLVLVVLVGAASEIGGIYSGFPFGAYEYTPNWKPTVLLPGGKHYPLLMPLSWLLVVGASCLTTLRVFGAKGWLLAPFLAVLVDVCMEPLMVFRLNYWIWEDPLPVLAAPAMNYVGWILVSVVAVAILWTCTAPLKGPEFEDCLPLLGFLLLIAGLSALHQVWFSFAAASVMLAGFFLWSRGNVPERGSASPPSELVEPKR